jgi:hypothetical protein
MSINKNEFPPSGLQKFCIIVDPPQFLSQSVAVLVMPGMVGLNHKHSTKNRLRKIKKSSLSFKIPWKRYRNDQNKLNRKRNKEVSLRSLR